MNRKLIGFALAFIFLAMLAAPLVSAKPTSAANNPNAISFLWHSENGAGTPMEGYPRINPPWAEPESPDVKVSHGHAVWNLNPAFSNYVQIGEDDPIPIDAVTGYEGELYVVNVITGPQAGSLNYHVYEKIMWGDYNYVEIMCLERGSYDMIAGEFYASGTFNGHGVIDGQKVQVTGIREGSFDPMIPGFVLQCYGTIRFAGKA